MAWPDESELCTESILHFPPVDARHPVETIHVGATSRCNPPACHRCSRRNLHATSPSRPRGVSLTYVSLRNHTSWSRSMVSGKLTCPHLQNSGLTVYKTMPAKLGKRYSSAKSLHEARSTLFCSLATVAFCLHAKSTAVALQGNLPHARLNWLPQKLEHEDHSQLAHIGIAIKSILWALSDHPAVSAVGWNVILSVISMCAWTVAGSVNVHGMLRCTVLPWLGDEATSAKTAKSKASVSTTRPSRSVSRSRAINDGDRATSRSRARSRRDTSDTAKSTSSRFASQSRSRSRSASATIHRKKRQTADPDSEPFAPTPYVREHGRLLAHASSVNQELAGPAEASALTLGLYILGGLGFASAGVFGGEMV